MYVQIAYLCEIIQWILVMKIGIKPMTFKVKIVHKIYMYICMCMFIYLDISMSIYLDIATLILIIYLFTI